MLHLPYRHAFESVFHYQILFIGYIFSLFPDRGADCRVQPAPAADHRARPHCPTQVPPAPLAPPPAAHWPPLQEEGGQIQAAQEGKGQQGEVIFSAQVPRMVRLMVAVFI